MNKEESFEGDTDKKWISVKSLREFMVENKDRLTIIDLNRMVLNE